MKVLIIEDEKILSNTIKEELKARIEAIIRRNNPNYFNKEIKFKDLVLETKTKKAYINSKELKIEEKRFDMLMYLIKYQGRIITKEQIYDKIWGFNSEAITNVVDAYVCEIREELKKYDYDKYFKIIKGVGYMIS